MRKKIITMFAVMAISLTAFTTNAFAEYSSNIVLNRDIKIQKASNLEDGLERLGFFHYSPIGYFGSLTAQPILEFQVGNSIASDGIAGYYTARELKVIRVLQLARQYMGVPYLWAGTSPSGFDCSGYIQYVFLNNGVSLARTTELQYEQGVLIDKSLLRPGDLVFFTTYQPGPSHVGIYLGNNQFIHASSGAKQVTISDLNKAYYAERYIGAKRVIP
ncbi:MAG: NlpC/P60 family protein [Clostridia bacterium]|nr:NlpC/P60 family protein [Clostridia bacterium]